MFLIVACMRMGSIFELVCVHGGGRFGRNLFRMNILLRLSFDHESVVSRQYTSA